ncbi:Isopenicillin N synthase [Nakamurella panacisegetis]|uniref:Isopenicillin N synthase n=1 Tax=Nakamurella panacisegetis TaxID=1090615 RepID=A0A1H0NMG3_9ACTN|nr:2-oxoglutarate and iron-dependent oxygenase domain-containing protein [Nakamurella panacisegetis]SDO93947.1 Isopenicillin N synthase [Nakamurella panacisegetis]
MNAFQVPIVDISPYTGAGDQADRRATAEAVDKACRTVGFIQIVGHRIPSDAIEGLTSAMDDFFSRPLGEKKKSTVAGVNRGYSAPKTEQLSLSLGVESATRMNDFFEAFNIGQGVDAYPDLDLPAAHYADNVWPDGVPGFPEKTQAWFAEAGRVARTLTSIFADALDLPPRYFDRFTDHSLDVLRMNNYALPPGEVDLDGGLTGMGEHTDYGIVTVLWADRVAGLQVLADDGSWHDVMPEPGALLVNLGDLTARWTNEVWKSTLHRVKPPVVNGRIERRRSAAYFHDGNVDALISTLPGMVEPGTTELYPPVTVADHISAKLAGSRSLVANANAEREALRVINSVG